MSNTKEILCHIADSIRETGNDPHDQLLGYVSTGDSCYITRRNNARGLIETVEPAQIQQFLCELRKAI